MNNIFLSIIIPAYNEALRVGFTLESLKKYFSNKDISHEIIVVDDGSKDDTVKIVQKYARVFPQIRILKNGKNMGKGYSVNHGMRKASGKYRLFMDADNSVDITHADAFLEEMKRGSDVVIGSIRAKNSHISEHSGWYRRGFGYISKLAISIFAIPDISDTQRGFKIFSGKVADFIFPLQTINRFGFDIELLVIARTNGFRIKEMPVNWNNPGGSTVTLKSYFQTLYELFNIVRNRFAGKYTNVINLNHTNVGMLEKFKRIIFGFEQNDNIVRNPLSWSRGFTYNGKRFAHYSDLHHTETALYNLMHFQKVALVIFSILYLGFLIINWHVTLIVTLSIITIVYFLDFLFNAHLIFKSFNDMPEIAVSNNELSKVSRDALPMYTIFCPLYKEWQVVSQFANAMNALDYPKEKLQIILLLEENDIETIRKIRNTPLLPHFEIVVVPHSNPKTKPKAMNYGLPFARGEYLVIYDAEDVPETDQLKKAVLAFKKVSSKVVCIQAKLNFYNIHQNILTRLFTAEYSLWFDLILPGLQSLNAPIPLGGTSNHFKTSALRELRGWDGFNVTEDADLGMRLAKRGYRTAIMESTTYEEANSNIVNWYNQRSRWIKGYIQTYFVHMRNPKAFVETGSIKDFLIFQMNIGGKILSMFINPLMWLITICYFLFRANIGVFIESFFPGPILYIGVFSLIFGNFLYIYYYMIGCAKRGFDGLIKYIFIIPFYWLGMSLAAWKAVYEIVVKPHYWSKTVHGLHLKKIEVPTVLVSGSVASRTDLDDNGFVLKKDLNKIYS